MTTTSQALKGIEATRYKKIKDKFANMDKETQIKLANKQARIVTDAIKNLPKSSQDKLKAKIADLIRTRIFGKSEFESPE
jgi:predicted flavoprotein YhiN